MSVQIIERNGNPEWAVVPYETYLQLLEQAEMLQDIRDYDTIKESLRQGDEELVPSDVVYAILDGENPIKAWRTHRGLSQQELAKAASVSAPYLSQLEAGKRTGSVAVLAAVAKALNVSVEDILATERQ